VPWLSYSALVESWASAADSFSATTDQMLSFADRTSSPERSLTLLCRGLPSAAIVLLLASDRQRLAMTSALVELEAHAGERELLDAFTASLAGASSTASLSMATTRLAQRGLALATALATCAPATIRPEAPLPVEMRAAAMATLSKAGATWLASLLPQQ